MPLYPLHERTVRYDNPVSHHHDTGPLSDEPSQSSSLCWAFWPLHGVPAHWSMIHRAHNCLARCFRHSCHGLFNPTLGTRHKGSSHSCKSSWVNGPYGCSFQATTTTAACQGRSSTAYKQKQNLQQHLHQWIQVLALAKEAFSSFLLREIKSLGN